jgi:hypothetical protein
MKWFLRYLQWEHEIPAIESMHKLIAMLTERSEEYPGIRALLYA